MQSRIHKIALLKDSHTLLFWLAKGVGQLIDNRNISDKISMSLKSCFAVKIYHCNILPLCVLEFATSHFSDSSLHSHAPVQNCLTSFTDPWSNILCPEGNLGGW